MVETNIITKSEAARRFAVSPSMITKYAQKGMPVEPNGRVDWTKAQHWHRCYIVPELSGSYHARQRKREAPAAVASKEPTARELFKMLTANAAKIPELLIKAGLHDIDLARAAADVFVDLVVVLGGAAVDNLYGPGYEDMPGLVDSDGDYEALAAAHALPAPNKHRFEYMLERFDAVVWN